jgi:syntaxin-binding protein 1
MAQESMRLFEQDKLPLVANVEQVLYMLLTSHRRLIFLRKCCATGMTAEGKSPKTLVEEMVPLLDNRDIKQDSPCCIGRNFTEQLAGI